MSVKFLGSALRVVGTGSRAEASLRTSEVHPMLLREAFVGCWEERVSMSRSRKITVIVVAVVLTASTPIFWLLDNPNTGQLVAASVQGATGIVALVWALVQSPTSNLRTGVVVADTGRAKATGGGRASTGVRRPQEAGNVPIRVERTGDATSEGPGSSASTGVDFS
ncbi:hypothetical protein [Streptomyces sp. NPDC005989]|uniref:hypothetical protein n=1 Tax=Streptomyces sp. NPDC005989 TaxID=3156727 RepID=UPI0033F7DCF5